MADMNYIEPGTYVSEEIKASPLVGGAAVHMYPLFIGRIPEIVPTSLNIVRTSEAFDAINAMYGTEMSVTSIRNSNNASLFYKTTEPFLTLSEENGVVKGFAWNKSVQLKKTAIKRLYVPIYGETEFNLIRNSGHEVYVACNVSTDNDGQPVVIPVTSTVTLAQSESDNAATPLWYISLDKTVFKDHKYNSMYKYFIYNPLGTVESEENEYVKYNKNNRSSLSYHDLADDRTVFTIDGEGISSSYNFEKEITFSTEIDAVAEGFVPGEGAVYTANFTFKPYSDSEYFSLKEWGGGTDVANRVAAFYGNDTLEVDYTKEGICFNPLTVAANISASIGETHFFTLAIPSKTIIKESNGTINIAKNEEAGIIFEAIGDKYVTTDGLLVKADDGILAAGNYRIDANATYKNSYAEALERECVGLDAENFYRIVPLDQGKDIATTIKNHTQIYSSEEERLECAGFVSIPKSSKYTTNDAYYEEVAMLASDLSSARLTTSYGRGKAILSNNNEVWLNTQYLLVAVAAMESLIKNGKGLTNSTIPTTAFSEIEKDGKRRKYKNTIAGNGVLIFEQNKASQAIKIRHALTTLSDQKYGKEMSVQRNIDYTKKYLRNICNPYIGKTNVTDETLELIEQTLNDGITTLCTEGWLKSGTIENIAVDEDNEDTIIVRLKIEVPFPLNYIYITLVLE